MTVQPRRLAVAGCFASVRGEGSPDWGNAVAARTGGVPALAPLAVFPEKFNELLTRRWEVHR
jgi:hypothetical protein